MYVALAIAASLILIAIAGFVWQQIGVRRDRRRWPAPGVLVDVDGLPLHLYVAGKGTPAVIFESGIAATTLNWTAVQARVAEFAQTVSYDRAGLSFSGPARTPRTPSHIVEELRSVLRRAGIRPPYVLVGHSFGGLVMRWFAAHYPPEVAAVILVDPLRPEDWTPVSDQQKQMLARGVMLLGRGSALAQFGIVRFCLSAVLTGRRVLPRLIGKAASGSGARVMDRIAGEIGKMPAEIWPVIAAHWSNRASFAGLRAHLRDLPESIREIASAPPIRGIPVTFITAGREPPVSEAVVRAVSPDAKHVVASASGHWIHLDEPELVVHAIREAVNAAQE